MDSNSASVIEVTKSSTVVACRAIHPGRQQQGEASALRAARTQICVKTLACRLIALNVGLLDSVQAVMAMAESREGIPPSHQLLLYAGKQLEVVVPSWATAWGGQPPYA